MSIVIFRSSITIELNDIFSIIENQIDEESDQHQQYTF